MHGYVQYNPSQIDAIFSNKSKSNHQINHKPFEGYIVSARHLLSYKVYLLLFAQASLFL